MCACEKERGRKIDRARMRRRGERERESERERERERVVKTGSTTIHIRQNGKIGSLALDSLYVPTFSWCITIYYVLIVSLRDNIYNCIFSKSGLA